MNGSGQTVWVVAVGSGLVLAAGGYLVAADPAAVAAGHLGVGGLLTLVWAGAAIAIARLRPGNLVGPLAALVALAVAVTVVRELLWQYLSVRPSAASGATWLMALLRESAVWLLVALAVLLLVFPDGRLPSPRWRLVPPVLVAAAAGHHLWGLVDPAPFRPPLDAHRTPLPPPGTLLEVVSVVAFVVMVLMLLACAASLFVRYRGGGPTERGQLRWLAVAGLGVPGYLLVGLVEVIVTGGPRWLSSAVGAAVVVGLPVVVAIAVLRWDLFDVDRTLTAAVTYGLLSGALAVVFTVVALGAGLVFGRDSVVVAVTATAVTAAALAPVRSRVRRAVARRTYPLRENALAAIGHLQRRIHDGSGQPEELEAVLREALHDDDLRVGYRAPAAAKCLDTGGDAVDADGSVAVLLAGEPIGLLRPGGGPASTELLRSVASASAVIVEVVRLRLELANALREVEDSRARIVGVGDAERRRLERDLHDGSQQRLVSLGMSLRLAQRQLSSGTVDVAALLDGTVAELGTAVAELRQLAQGLRPSRLDDGLPQALVSLAQHVPVPLVLDVPDHPLPEELATTLYYVASEAIANAVKHADASRIDVQLVRHDGCVQLRVTDDGCGGAVHADAGGRGPAVRRSVGSGLVGLRDRVAAAGGHVDLRSPPGGGTRLEVELPCGS